MRHKDLRFGIFYLLKTRKIDELALKKIMKTEGKSLAPTATPWTVRKNNQSVKKITL